MFACDLQLGNGFQFNYEEKRQSHKQFNQCCWLNNYMHVFEVELNRFIESQLVAFDYLFNFCNNNK